MEEIEKPNEIKKKSKKRKRVKLLFRDAFFSTLLSLFVFSLLSLLVFNTNFFSPSLIALKDFSFLDTYYSQVFYDNEEINGDIILINVSNTDRAGIADIIQDLRKESSSVIGVDIIFKNAFYNKSDTMLKKALNSNKVVLASTIIEESLITSHPFFINKQPLGIANFGNTAKYEVVRSFLGIHKEDNEFSNFSFPLLVAMKSLKDTSWLTPEKYKKLSRLLRIKYVGNYKHFLALNSDEFYALDNKSIFKNKTVLLGYLGEPMGSVHDIEDKHYTPLNAKLSGKSIPDMYGLTIHANIVNMILTNDYIYELSNLWLGILILIFSYAASLYFIWLDRKLKISYRTVRKAVLFVFSIVLIGIMLWLFKNKIVVNTLPIIMVTFFSAGFIKYYKHLIRYMKTKHKFKSYIK